MPDCSDCTCMLVCVSSHIFAHETAGAASTRHSLRPLHFGRMIFKPRAHRAARTRSRILWKPARHCERSDLSAVAQRAKAEAIHYHLACGKMDCFASLAMTVA